MLDSPASRVSGYAAASHTLICLTLKQDVSLTISKKKVEFYERQNVMVEFWASVFRNDSAIFVIPLHIGRRL